MRRPSEVMEGIYILADKYPYEVQPYLDGYNYLKSLPGDPNVQLLHQLMSRVSRTMTICREQKKYAPIERMYEVYRGSLFYVARVSFDDFCIGIEFDRHYDKKFYAPRRHYLHPMVEGYQMVYDGKLRLLTVSMPKRAGKSQTEILFTLMKSGNNPNGASLMEGTGDDLVNSFYKGCLEYLETPNEYNFYDIFPECSLVQTNADLKTLNLNTKSRFPTIMCRSIDSRQVGLSEASNVLTLDDCVEGRKEAKNRMLLDQKWEVISGDIIGRALEGTPIIFTGTRYSLYDPIGRIQEFAREQGWNWKAIEIPALDLITDESNYEYERKGKKYFTTAFFREQRNMLSAEQWESEFQQQPFEAKGLLFNKDELNYYRELPVDPETKETKEPDYIFVQGDTAESGEDSVAMLVAYIYGNDVYIEDVVFDNSPPDVTKPECASCIIRHKAGAGQFESNNAGTYYARDVEEICLQRGHTISIRVKFTSAHKQTKIELASDNIKKNFYFKHPDTYKRGSQYWAFMRELTTYTRTGKVEHDDAPDVCAMLENTLRTRLEPEVEVFDRPF